MSDFPPYDLPDISGNSIDQLGQFEDILLKADKNGLVNSVPENEKETYDLEKQRIRLQTAATRLYLLGYLKRKIDSNKLHKKLDELKTAVLQFQRDANLKPDKWIGDKTWYALDELVSFESELTEEQWFVNGKVRPEVTNAMHRAIQLRLWSLGLYSKQPRPKQKILVKRSLYKFNIILKKFRIKDMNFVSDFNYETLKVLFDQDELISSVAKSSRPNSGSYFVAVVDAKKKEAERNLIKSFVINCAKIELWLLGLDIDIDGSTKYEFQQGDKISNAIYTFYVKFEEKHWRTARKLSMSITPQLLLTLGSATISSTNAYDEDEASEEVAKYLQSTTIRKTTNRIKKAWTYVKEKGVILWDGIKRIWRWVKKIGKKVFGFLEKNIFRAFYRYASKAYKIFTRGIAAVLKSIWAYIKGRLVFPGLYYGFSKDMDSNLYVSKAISPQNGEVGVFEIERQSKAFNLGCRIVGFLFHVFKNLSLGLLGWAKLLFSLLKSYKKLKVIYEDFKLVAEPMA